MGLFGGSKPILGLDIGSHSIKAMVLDKGRSGLVLSGVGLTQLPPEAVVDGVVKEEGLVVTAIKNLLKSLKIGVKRVSTSISGNAIVIKKIKLPATSREELAKTIEVEAEAHIPFDISEVNVDFQIVGESESGGEQMDVVVVAAKKDLVQGLIALLETTGLRPTVIDVDVFALENAFTHNHPDIKEVVALIDIGANKININVLKNGASIFTKDAGMGGAGITSELQFKFDLEYEEAESIKLGGQEAPDPKAVADIVGRAAESWLSEFKRALDFLEATQNEHVQSVYLSGGSARIDGLEKYFSSQLNLPVTIFDPLQNVGINPAKFDPAYIQYLAPQVAICLGLALRRGEEI